ncbi:Ankyrin repeat-containing domain [Pseudocohnilembus persalinus]|uniref:Ankyrin repeat-containing domain n=1 Tax=Pseudocohnilembus persalinus TaxID=266149 RepID=A0A0V0QWU6_PSEPJ|nr:Ankyrin repeat-containing domain [Pseudocohnilembus persalinus]|eukprot:KRX06408.1 Ankyrin repeat-containing domain [Pseudocohnilembus persalinus]
MGNGCCKQDNSIYQKKNFDPKKKQEQFHLKLEKLLINHNLSKNEPQDYEQVINLTTAQNYTPLSICCIYDKINCLKVLITHGGIDLYIKQFNKSCYQLALYFESEKVLKYLKQYQITVKTLIIPLKIQKFGINQQNSTLLSEESQNSPHKKRSFDNIKISSQNLEQISHQKSVNIQFNQSNIRQEQDEMDIFQSTAENGFAIYDDCLQRNQSFIDYEFQHDISSLTYFQNYNEQKQENLQLMTIFPVLKREINQYLQTYLKIPFGFH